jgi:integrase
MCSRPAPSRPKKRSHGPQLALLSATQTFVNALRAFLRFCFIDGLVGADLSQAALLVRRRSSSPLPRGISRADAHVLLGSCDRRQALGRRDYAIILTLLRLGLRRSELAGLRLDDIDWRAGELVVRGKGAREDRLPLPADVGEAIATYLRRGRPQSSRREVFLRSKAPYQPIASATVTSTVRRACRRAGIPEFGSHRLRHTAACEMVAANVPLVRIGQVLRHRSLQSTARYARVDARAVAVAGGAVAGRRSAAMSGLQTRVDEYLRLRRALGFKLKEEERLLGQLVGYLEAAGAETVKTELAVRWARLPVGVHPNHWSKRLRVARGFAAYLHTLDPTAEIPPPDIFPHRRQRATPYLFSQQDICRLLEEARRLRNPMRAASYEALFGLLAVSGMRIGEAVALEREDVDLDAGLITIRKAKGDRARLVPLHPTSTEALRRYASERDRLCPAPRSRAFLSLQRRHAGAGGRPAPDVQGDHDPDRHPDRGGAPAGPRSPPLRGRLRYAPCPVVWPGGCAARLILSA